MSGGRCGAAAGFVRCCVQPAVAVSAEGRRVKDSRVAGGSVLSVWDAKEDCLTSALSSSLTRSNLEMASPVSGAVKLLLHLKGSSPCQCVP